jgi:hypothetical protein
MTWASPSRFFGPLGCPLPRLKLAPNYSGKYDFYLYGEIGIEVNTSRAVDADNNEPLYVKA